MDSTEQLIESLSNKAAPVKPVANPLVLFAKWCLACIVYMAVLLFFFGLRDDLTLKLHTPMFVSELIFLALIMITTGLSAAALSFPDIYQKHWLLFTPIAPLSLFVSILYIALLQDSPPAPLPPHGVECLLCISFFSLIPTFGLLYLLRKQATTHYYLAGSLALLAASSIGCFTLRLSEKTDSMPHLIEWHYLPMIGFGIIGLGLGRRFLKW